MATVLDREECVRLLATQVVGRVGFVHAGMPEILPVNYVLDGDAIVFATALGTKLSAVERGTVTFEVDDIDDESRAGWSVVVHGMAEEITDTGAPDLVARVRAHPPQPWDTGDKRHLVRIAPRSITGRHVARS